MKKPRWLLQTCELCGAKYSVRWEELESSNDNRCARCRHMPSKVDKEKELVTAKS
jgi:hypothetical protein